MGTTSMAPEPRTTNGEKAEVKTDLDTSKVLTDEQRAELKKAKETNGKKPAAKKTAASKKETAAKAPSGVKKPAAKKTKTTATKTATVKAPSGVKKIDLGHALTAVRGPLKDAWKAIEGDDLDGYITQVKLAVEKAKEAIKLAEKMKAQQAK